MGNKHSREKVTEQPNGPPQKVPCPIPMFSTQVVDGNSLLMNIRNSIVGRDSGFLSPFGLRRITYADYTASGRSLQFIEDYLQSSVLPFYANTHTDANFTGSTTSAFREESRNIIRECVGGDERDAVLFCGSGSTGAIDKIVHILELRNRNPEKDTKRPVIFVGPYEHHSNELSWKETIADVIEIPEQEDGTPSLTVLKEKLIEYNDRPLKIGSFNALSNVTGIITDTKSIAKLLHQYGAFAFFDFATAGPYFHIQMNFKEDESASMDAIFLSPHKMIGGPGTPGILVAKRHLFRNKVPSVPGGGTVMYVFSKDEYQYLADTEAREEGGTPAIIESIRAGLVFKLKQTVTPQVMEKVEEEYYHKGIQQWSTVKNLQILGNPKAKRLPIFSFVIFHRKKYVHYQFNTTLLNDLFGIQARGGCSCAGPYGSRLLEKFEKEWDVEAFKDRFLHNQFAYKPGWTRINFNYFESPVTVDYMIKAVEFVAVHGWKFLPLYHLNVESGQWAFQAHPLIWNSQKQWNDLPSLYNVDFTSGFMQYSKPLMNIPETFLQQHLQDAYSILEKIIDNMKTHAKRLTHLYQNPDNIFIPFQFVTSSEAFFEILESKKENLYPQY
jgi:selenocysteine lyase/cysteine desulfurase